MVDNTKENSNLKRRDVLKSGAVAIGATGISATAMTAQAAKQEGLSLGTSAFIEATLEHNVPSDKSLGHLDGLRRYSIHRDQGLVGLVSNPATSVFSDADAVVTTGRDFSEVPADVFGNTTTALTVDADHPTASERVLFLESKYTQPKLEINSANTDEVNASIGDEKVTFSAGEERTVSLSPAEVEVPDDTVYLGEKKPDPEYKTIEVEPRIELRHNGSVDVFGKQGRYIVPMNANDPFTQRFKGMRKDNEGSSVVKKAGPNLFVGVKGGRNDSRSRRCRHRNVLR